MYHETGNSNAGERENPKLLLKFSIPCVMGLLIGALYNIVDQIFIGNSELGYLSNAATTVISIVVLTVQFFRKLPKNQSLRDLSESGEPMKKYIALLGVLVLVLSMAGCGESGVLPQIRSYSVEQNVHSLDIQIGAANLTIVATDSFGVESNLKYLTVSQENGVLTVHEETKLGVNYTDARLTVYIPSGTQFESIQISTGAANLTAGDLTAAEVTLLLGAGNVQINSLTATERSQIRGGAGNITISHGSLQDLIVEMGVGALDMTVALPGSSELNMGVGNAQLTLLGDPQDYRIHVEKGLGSVMLDGEPVTDLGSGENSLQITGGVGDIDLQFVSVTDPTP